MATITIEQIQKAQEKLNKVQEEASNVNEILVKVQGNIIEGIELTSTQKTALLDAYQAAKVKLQTAVNELL